MSIYSFERGTLKIEDAKFPWRPNFSGRPTKFNPQGGDRSFGIVLDEETGLRLKEEGWNIKPRAYQDDEDEVQYTTDVKVEFEKGRPPKIYIVDDISKKMTLLTKRTVSKLDDVYITHMDMTITPSKNCKGYLQTMFVTIEEDDFDGKYRDYEHTYNEFEDDEEEMPFD